MSERGGASAGVMVCGHGSRDEHAVAEFQRVAAGLRDRLPGWPIESGYLEFARPTIREGLGRLVERGVGRILAVPGMLFAASHVKNDLPWELNTFLAENPGVEIVFGRDLGIEPKLLAAAAERIEAAERAAAGRVPRPETLLVVVGRGTNDSDANSNISKVARMLSEGMRFGWAEAAYSGVAHPRVEACLERACRLGFRRILVFPYFLFTGVLVRRIHEETRAVAARHREVEFLEAGYLSDHRLVLEAFVERIHELSLGEPAMNCRLCKYRIQIVGYEHEVGAAQAGHHHHVVGIGATAGHHHGLDAHRHADGEH